jgi:hypothetical protein
MVKWRGSKPEVIAYVSSMYSPEHLPNWVGVIEGDVDYREFLRSKGVELPAMVDDRNSMDDDSVDIESQEKDIAEGMIPAQASTIEGNDTELQTPMDTKGHLRTPTNGNLRNPPMEATDVKLRTPMEATDDEPRTPMEVKVKEVPKRELPPLYYSSQRVKSPDPNIITMTAVRK